MTKFRTAFCLLFAAAALHADQIVLKNGDRVTGSIVKKDGNTLTVKSDLMGTVTIPWDQVTDIKTTGALNVALTGQAAGGTKETISSANGQIMLTGAQGAAPQTVAPTAISAIRNDAEQTAYERMLHPGILQLWTGTATLGLAGTSGNAVTSSFTTGFNAARATNHDTTSVYFNAVKSSATINGTSAETAQAVMGGWKYGRNVGSRLAVNVFNDYQYDKFQNLDLRFVLGAGLGYRAWKGKKGQLTIPFGADYDRDKFGATSTAKAFSRTSGEAYWGDDFNFKVNGATNLVQTFRMFDNLSNTGAYRMNFDVSLATKLSKVLTWNLTFGDRRVSNPDAGRKPNDVLYTTGIGVTFGK